MAIDQSKINDYAMKLRLSRMRLLASYSFYGLLLSHTKFSLDENCPTAYTDGRKIAFNPDFLERLTDEETDFVLMHEILHIALQHCFRGHDYDAENFNIACDIVVNSNILQSFGGNKRKISIDGEPLMHMAPDGTDGYNYTAEEVYDMLPKNKKKKNGSSFSGGNNSGSSTDNGDGDGNDNSGGKGTQNSKKPKTNSGSEYYVFDDHSFWTDDNDEELEDAWEKHFEDACKIVSIEDASKSCGSLPAFAERILRERKNAQTNWREVLNNFVQDEINDYSFNPPDKRFDGSDFMLPDFNEAEETVKDILFMIDTSGSMTDKMITQAYDEIRGAIDQFNGRLEGLVGFFDAVVVEPKPFSSIDELDIIRPYGGGGTRFDIIFKYVANHMSDHLPSSIVILTDGYAPFPKESVALDIPVLWVINNDDVTPPWGKHTTITVE